MKPNVTFTEIYSQWLDSFRAIFPGGRTEEATRQPTPNEALIAAKQEWEDEGGSIKPPEKTPGVAPGPKIPF